MGLTAGTKIRILSVGNFNENFVKVGDIAEIQCNTEGDLYLYGPGWRYTQYTHSSFEGADFEVIEEQR